MNKRISNHFKSLNRSQQGVVLITVLFISLLLTFVGLSLADVAIAQFSRTNKNVFVSNSLLSAEAGIERTLYEFNQNGAFAGFSETNFYNDSTQGRGTFETTITAGSGPNERVITSTGRTYRYGNNVIESTRKVRVTVVGTVSPGYSVHSGVGGLILSGSANITNSKLYINGGITMSGAARIGSASQPLDVFVANQKCPSGATPGPTYAQVCGSGQPISMSGSSRIYGNVCATGQTQSVFGSANITGGSTGTGLQTGCTAPVSPMPTYDRAAHIAKMSTVATPSNIIYDCSSWKNPEGFVRTWPANIRMNGNVSWSSSCDLTITGDVYITGNLDIGGSARIRIANSLGTTRPVIVVDGTINVAGSSQLIPNSSGTAAHFISFRSSAACTPSCATVTGNDLYNSQNLTTVNVAGAGNYPGTVFQAYWSKVILGGSGNMGSAIGQTIDLSGAGNIVFGTTLSSGTSTWTVRSYQYDFD